MSAVEKRDDNTAHNAIVTFRGQPLTDTPAKSTHIPFALNSRLPIRKNKFLPLPSPNSNIDSRKCNTASVRNFGKENIRESDDDLLTRENTKANTGYKTIKLQTVRVQMTTPKPPSPSSHFRKEIAGGPKKPIAFTKITANSGKNVNNGCEDKSLSSPSPPTGRPRRVKFIKQNIDNNEEGEGVFGEKVIREIPYYDTTIPLTSCLKKEPSVMTRQNRGSGMDDEDLIVVKKLVYPPTPPKTRKKK
jgi:hypothetical protein